MENDVPSPDPAGRLRSRLIRASPGGCPSKPATGIDREFSRWLERLVDFQRFDECRQSVVGTKRDWIAGLAGNHLISTDLADFPEAAAESAAAAGEGALTLKLWAHLRKGF